MKNKDLDKMLKQLGDFDPQAKPDWEAFVAENEPRINTNRKTPDNESGKGFMGSKTARYAGAFIAAVTALFITWYFAGSPTLPSPDPQPQKTEIRQDQPQETPTPEIKSAKAESESVSTEIQKSEHESGEEWQPVKAEPDPDLKELAKPDTPEQEPETTKFQNTEPAEPVTVTDTVYIKRTIHITDTVKRK